MSSNIAQNICFILAVLFCITSKGQITLPFKQISIEDGLSALHVTDMTQDESGFLWFTTKNGVNRYDGESFRVYSYNPNLENTLSSNYTTSIIECQDKLLITTSGNGINIYDKKKDQITNCISAENRWGKNIIYRTTYKDDSGKLWIGTQDHGLFEYNSDSESLISRYNNNNLPKSVQVIRQNNNDKLWLGTENGLIQFDLLNGFHQLFTFKSNSTSKLILENNIRDIAFDIENDIWLGSANGLLKLNKQTNELIKVTVVPTTLKITSLYSGEAGQLWIATMTGLFIYDNTNKSFTEVLNKNNIQDHKSLRGINSIYKDRQGILWFTGRNGIHKLYPQYLKKGFSQNLSFPEEVLNCKNSRAIYQSNEVLWISMDDGFYRYDLQTKEKEKILEQRIIRIFEDKDQNIWASSIDVDGVFKFNLKGELELHLPTSIETNLLSEKTINQELTGGITFSMAQDYKGNMWFAGDGSLNLFNCSTHEISTFHYEPGNLSSLSDSRILNILIDRHQQLWIGTFYDGLNKLDLRMYYDNNLVHFKQYKHISQDKTTISNNTIRGIIEDSKGSLWISTLFGINKYNRNTENFKQYIEALPTLDKRIASELLSKNGNLWFATEDSGLLLYDELKDSFQLFNHLDGIPSSTFHRNAATNSIDRQMLFSKKDGIHLIDESTLLFNIEDKGPLYITEVKINDKTIHKDLSSKHQFGYKQNNISFSFAELNYFRSTKISYEYKLEGFESNWNPKTTKNQVRYRELSPGNYTFQVRSANNEKHITRYDFKINPPFWKSNIALIVYLFTLICTIIKIYNWQLRRQIEKQQSKRLVELDELKNKLYTSISHEFRTPLTIIEGMASKITDYLAVNNKAKTKEAIKLINSNTKNLNSLINQMLSLSKLEAGKEVLILNQHDIVKQTKYIIHSLESYANFNTITITQHHENHELFIDVDTNKWQSIVTNLMSNAIKYGKANGSISITTQRKENNFVLKIADDGIGINEKDIPFIFTKYFKVDQVQNGQASSGIGLAVVSELVKLMNGTISVDSTLGLGTSFTIHIPISNNAAELCTNLEAVKHPIEDQAKYATHHKILIVEDNKDVAYYIAECLREKYQILYAKNGQVGVDKAIQTIPDFIISDVMMPLKDGFNLCNELKAHQLTNHIPILLLTARADKDSKVEGLNCGADAYLAKPFDKDELLARIKQLILLRHKLQEKYAMTSIQIASPQKQIKDEFLDELTKLINQNLNNYQLDVQFICKKLGVSRTQLHRKLHSLVKLSTTAFIRTIKIKKAQQLLLTTDMTISEIAFDSGFNSLSYFNRVFSKVVGSTAMQYRNVILERANHLDI